MLRQFLHFGIGVIILSLLVRTWIAMGLVVPVVVSAGSMAPHLVGPHRSGRCQTCSGKLTVGLEYASPRQTLTCPDCGRDFIAGQLRPASGDAIWVDRLAFLFRSPRRWEPIVFRCPERATDYCIKRVVGLPTETLSLLQGDVLIDGQIVRKTLAEQLALRIPVHQHTAASNCWRPERQPSIWRRDSSGWRADITRDDTRGNVLRFDPQKSWPLQDGYAYNAESFAAKHALHDLMVACDVVCRGQAALSFLWADGRHEWLVGLAPAARQVTLDVDGRQQGAARIQGRQAPTGSRVRRVLVSRFDRQTLVAIDGVTWLRVPDRPAEIAEPLRRLEIRAEGTGPVAIHHVHIFRDVYYTTPYWLDQQTVQGEAGRAVASWRLGPREFFVLGDNSPVSDDSRRWQPRPGLDAQLMLGKPLRPRWRSP